MVGEVVVLKVGAEHAAGLHDLPAHVVDAAPGGCVVDLVPPFANVLGASLIRHTAAIVLGRLQAVGVCVFRGKGGVGEDGEIECG